MNSALPDLTTPLTAVTETLAAHRDSLNRADAHDGDHGDNMLEAFQAAAQAAWENADLDLVGALNAVSQRLAGLQENGSARVYAQGLASFAEQFHQYGITAQDLATAFQPLLEGKDPALVAQSGNVIQALVAAMAGWQRAVNGEPPDSRGAGMGFLMEMGIAYMQAQQRGGSTAEILADAAVTASPLSRSPHRELSGKLAVRAFLDAVL